MGVGFTKRFLVGVFLKNSSNDKKLLIYIFLIPLIYFTIQPVKLPQYLTIVISGFILGICYGYYMIYLKLEKLCLLLFKALILTLFIFYIIDGILWKRTIIKTIFL